MNHNEMCQSKMGEDSDVEDVHGYPLSLGIFPMEEGCARAGPQRSDEGRDKGKTVLSRELSGGENRKGECKLHLYIR